MSTETSYEATKTGVEIVQRGREEWRVDLIRSTNIGDLTWEDVADFLNQAYQLGRTEQRADIRKALGVR